MLIRGKRFITHGGGRVDWSVAETGARPASAPASATSSSAAAPVPVAGLPATRWIWLAFLFRFRWLPGWRLASIENFRVNVFKRRDMNLSGLAAETQNPGTAGINDDDFYFFSF